jgi:hypothetical protein
MPDDTHWIIIADFHFIGNPEGRNKPGGDANDMLIFTNAISHLSLVELPLKGRKITSSYMQQYPLLEKQDWFLTSSSWTTSYPPKPVFSLLKPTSNHFPCVISIAPKF